MNHRSLQLFIFFSSIFFLTSIARGSGQSDSIQHKLNGLDNLEKINYFGQLSWELRQREPKQSLYYGKLAVQMADSFNLVAEKAKFSNFLGVAFLYNNVDLTNAIYYFEQALETGLKIKDSVQIAYAYNNISDVYFEAGHLDESREFTRISIDYFQKIKNSEGIAYGYINMGKIAGKSNQLRESLDYFNQAQQLYNSHKNINIYTAALFESGLICLENNKLDEALQFFKSQVETTEEINNLVYKARGVCGIGDIYYRKGDYKRAMEHYNEAIRLNQARGYEFGEISPRLGRALVFSMSGKNEKGEKEFEIALSFAKNIGSLSKLIEIQKAYVTFYKNLGIIPKTNKLIDQFLVAYDSLYWEQQYYSLNEIQSKQRLLRNLDDINIEYKNKRKEALYLLLLFFFAALIVVVLIWQYRIKNKLSKALRKSNDAKDKLFSIIAHDLRSPFIGIMQYFELLRSNALTSKQKEEYLEFLDNSTSKTYALLENLLNLSVYRKQGGSYQPQPFDVCDLINQIENNLYAQLKSKNIKLEISCKNATILGDSKMLEITIRNLISNAIKYSKKGGSIQININTTQKENTISIIDHGIGMSPNILSELRNKTFTNSTPGTQGEKGTGIGLNLCHEIIEIHNGKLEISSTENVGSTFTIILAKTTN